jgi:hypothetical protein
LVRILRRIQATDKEKTELVKKMHLGNENNLLVALEIACEPEVVKSEILKRLDKREYIERKILVEFVNKFPQERDAIKQAIADSLYMSPNSIAEGILTGETACSPYPFMMPPSYLWRYWR